MAPATQVKAQRVGLRHARRFVKLFLFWICVAPSLFAQVQPETVGRIEGDDIALRGQASVVSEGGRSTTLLVSGSEVTVRTGYARLLLVEGGEIGICGPAQLSVLKSGGALTVALNSGRVHARLEDASPVTIYTPLVVATPLSISGNRREMVIGLEATGSICVRAARGAVRIEEQLTGLSLVVPEQGEVVLPEGQLESLRHATDSCLCEALAAYKPTAPTPPEVSALAAAPARENKSAEKKEEPPKPPAREEPTWRVVMPPLTFDAAAAAPPPEPSPEKILLIREVRVQPTLVFHGRVEPRSPTTEQSDENASLGKKKVGFGGRIKNFFRRLFGGQPKR